MTALQDGQKSVIKSAPSLRVIHRQLARAVTIFALSLAAGGCVFAPVQSFTLQADVPADFRVKADAYYVPATGETCEAPPRKRGEVAPNRKFFKSEYQSVARTAEFQIPLTTRAGGCPLVLRSVRLNLDAKWGTRWSDIGGDFASLSFRDVLGADFPALPGSGAQEFEGQCQWLFRTVGPKRNIRKLLHCRAVDADGQMMKRMAGGVLQRDQLPGRTVRMVFKMAEQEAPYFDLYWFKTAGGWKPCGGVWGRDIEELCLDPPQFKDFKMPDGRTCTVYPNCTE
ncbi:MULTISPECIES: hypothetical protein [unclassified Pseudomonas]|uniref:Lipoprotein n=1 Tax=Pseudomonas sp. MYb327 TaxID=2745230 RepID=A0AAU8E697_9PSED